MLSYYTQQAMLYAKQQTNVNVFAHSDSFIF